MTVRELTGEQKEALEHTVDAMKLTPQEVNKFEKAFKDPEFLRLFEEYAKEMEDPATKAETEAYLRQVESEGQVENVYGRGAQLIVPSPEFLIKTKVKGNSTKVFVNVCSSDKINKPTSSEATSRDGVKGESWSIPLSLSAQRKGADKAGLACWVYDFTIHPDAIAKSLADPRFMDIMMDSAFERIEKATESTLQRNYKRLNAKFKTTASHDKPGVQAIRGEGGQVADGRLKPNPNQSGLAGLPAIETPKPVGSKEATGKRSSFSFDQSRTHKATQQSRKPSDPGFKHPSGEVTPNYQIVESGNLDLGDAWSDKVLSTPLPCPKHLLLRVELSGVTSVSGVDLEVAPQKVSLRVAGRYLLDIDLRHRVRDSDSRAKFDKAKSRLEITLPVVPPQRVDSVAGKLPHVGTDTAIVQNGPRWEPQSATNGCSFSTEPAPERLCTRTTEAKLRARAEDQAVLVNQPLEDAETTLRQAGAQSTQPACAPAEIVCNPVEARRTGDDASDTVTDAAGASDLRAVAQRWADVNRERDVADQQAVAEQNASTVAVEVEGRMKSAATVITDRSNSPAPANCELYARVAASSCGLGPAGNSGNARTVMLAPALQTSFVEELD